MPAGKVLLEIIGQFIFEFFGQTLVDFVSNIYNKLRKFITGKEPKTLELDRLKNRYLNREVRLRVDLNKQLTKGSAGTVIEIIDESILLVDFRDFEGKSILFNEKKYIEIEKDQLVLSKNIKSA